MLKKWLCIALAIAMTACLFSFVAAEEAYTFTDDTGVTVTVDKRPETVAVLFSSYAQVWQVSGGMVAITVGEAVTRGFAQESVTLVDPGAGHTAVDLETLVSLQPDLVIGTADYACQVEAAAFLNSIGIPSALFRVEEFEDYLHMLDIYTTLTGNREAYKTYGLDVEKRIQNILAQASGMQIDRKRVLFIRAGATANATKAKNTSDHFVCAMLKQLGVVNIADNVPSLLGGLSVETILIENPDFIFITTMGSEEAAKSYVAELFSQPGWADLAAVQQGQYAFLDKELFHFKPNDRWDEAYEVLMNLLCKGTE